MRVTRWQAVRRLHRMQKWRTTSETGRGKVMLLPFLLFTELYLRSGLDLVVVAAGRMPALCHAKKLEEFCGLVVVTGENLGEILVAQVPRYGFADYLAKVGGHLRSDFGSAFSRYVSQNLTAQATNSYSIFVIWVLRLADKLNLLPARAAANGSLPVRVG